jgi:malate dehydrogenase
MVPLPRYSTVAGIPITELMAPERVEALVQRTRDGGAEIVKLLQTGSAFYAPASSAVQMAESILRDKKRLLPVAAYLQGEYGMRDLYLGVPAILGSKGVEKIVELKLDASDQTALAKSADEVRKGIADLALEPVAR